MYKRGVAATLVVKAVSATDGVTASTGLSITGYVSKDGGTFAVLSTAIAEIGRGWYLVSLTAAEMTADSIALDFTATGAIVAGVAIHTEADYTAAKAGFIDASINSRLPSASYVAPLTAADTRTAVGLGSANLDTQLSTIAGYIDTEVASIVAALANGSTGLAAIKSSVDSISTATNAGDLATKTVDASTLTTGSTISGTSASTSTNDGVYWITAPTSTAVAGFGLRQQIVFNLPVGRTPVGLQIRGYWSGSGQTVDIYAKNARTGAFDKLTNSSTNLVNRSTDSVYSIPLPRDYGDDTGGAFNVVTIEFRTASTNTTHRLRVDQALITHVTESVAVTSSALTAEQVWRYVTRELTTPGVEPVTPPSAATIASAVRTELGTELGRVDVAVSSRASQASVDGIATGTPPSASTIASAVRTELTTELGRIDVATSTRASQASVSALPAAPSAASVASAVRTELSTELGRVDAAVSTRATQASVDAIGAAPSAATVAAAVRTNLATELARIDVATSTRLALAAYITPDNTGIAAIKAKTDALPADPADASDVAAGIAALGSALPASTASAVRTNLATELAYLDAPVSSAGGGLDAVALRSALGMSAANLDAQIGAIPEAVVDQTLAGHTTTGTVGGAINRLFSVPGEAPVLVIPGAPTEAGVCRVYGYLEDVDNAPAAGVEVKFELLSSVPVASERVIASKLATVTTDADGYLEIDLQRNDLLTPAGTFYRISYGSPRVMRKVALNAPMADLRELLTA